MKRDTLTRYLRSLVMATLAGCCSTTHKQDFRQVDAASIQIDGGIPDSGVLPIEVCRSLCADRAGTLVGCTIDAFGNLRCERESQVCGPPLAGGPAPPGLRAMDEPAAADPVAGYFARMAHVEEAAVLGFAQLADELAALGAPASLRSQARAASEDERRHARIARRLARDFGAQPPPVIVDATEPRSPLAIALHNATEGGVDETFAAALTIWQSERARDRRVRAAFASISVDELRHAELARAVAAWLEPRLSPAARREVTRARRNAAARLRRRFSREPEPRLAELAGLPRSEVALALVARMTRDLWS